MGQSCALPQDAAEIPVSKYLRPDLVESSAWQERRPKSLLSPFAGLVRPNEGIPIKVRSEQDNSSRDHPQRFRRVSFPHNPGDRSPASVPRRRSAGKRRLSRMISPVVVQGLGYLAAEEVQERADIVAAEREAFHALQDAMAWMEEDRSFTSALKELVQLERLSRASIRGHEMKAFGALRRWMKAVERDDILTMRVQRTLSGASRRAPSVESISRSRPQVSNGALRSVSRFGMPTSVEFRETPQRGDETLRMEAALRNGVRGIQCDVVNADEREASRRTHAVFGHADPWTPSVSMSHLSAVNESAGFSPMFNAQTEAVRASGPAVARRVEANSTWRPSTTDQCLTPEREDALKAKIARQRTLVERSRATYPTPTRTAPYPPAAAGLSPPWKVTFQSAREASVSAVADRLRALSKMRNS